MFNKIIYKTLFFYLLWHISISIPILVYISKKGNWSFVPQQYPTPYRNFSHPLFILSLAVAMVYPLLWGLFLSLSRYIRLGSTLDLKYTFISYIDYFIVGIFIIPFIFYWALLLLFYLKNLQNVLWSYTEFVVFSFHLRALQYYDYFRICQLIHKLHFVIFDLFFQSPGAYYKHFDDRIEVPYFIRFTKLIQNVYYKLHILHIIFFSSLIIEIILKKGLLFVGIYSLFIYPTILSCLRLFHYIGRQDLIQNMCMSDYLYVNFKNPRYYLKFWFFAKNPQLWYGFIYKMDSSLQQIFDETVLLEKAAYNEFIKFHRDIIYRIHGYKSTNISVHKTSYPRTYGVKIGSAHPWIVRVAAFYKSRYGVRWYHSTRVLLGLDKGLLHPFTAKFIKDPYAILAYILADNV